MKEGELLNLLQHIIPDITPTQNEDRYCYYDCKSDVYNCQIELKCRYKEYEDGYIIEKSKYQKLIKNKRCRYINSIKNKKIYSWNLKKIPEPIWFKKMLPKTTEFGNRQWIEKEVGLLSVKDAKDITEILQYYTN